ncbi:DsbA family protein [Marivirga lumbricoides]|uniref:DsbA family protein n=1 Tax=Marivirga lumbricoides TaxID=1046115 RepID=A0ABQ1MXT3_9BACT|nr:DsbA family protein [Marivirga lumbricoides]
MENEKLNLLYIWDGYCGWCYGFSKELTKFHNNHPELPITVLPGGLFTGDKSLPISNYPHIPEANQRINQLTGAVFGDSYNNLLKKGNFLLNSEDAGKGFVALKHFAPSKQYEIANAMMKLFYLEGKSLSDPETYGEIAQNLEIDPEKVMTCFHTENALIETQQLFMKVKETGVNSYPTLLLQKGEEMIKIGGGVANVEKLEENLKNAVELFSTKRSK